MDQLKLKGNPGIGLTGATMGFFFGFAAVSLYGPTAIKFKESMDLSPALVGFLVAIPALSGSLLRIPFGAWADSTGGRKPFLTLLLLSLIGLGGITLLLFLGYPDHMHGYYGLVLFLGMLSGCGIATFSVGIGQTSYWFKQKKQGKALGLYAGLGNLAPGVFSIILPLYLQYFGFISAYFAWFLFLLLGTIVYAFIGTDAYYFQFIKSGYTISESQEKASKSGQELFPSGKIRDSLRISSKSLNTWKLAAIYFTSFGGFIALTAWFPIYWCEFHGFKPVKAGLFTAVFSILVSAIRVFGGSISDKFGGEKTSLVAIIIIFIASAVLSFIERTSFVIAGIFLLTAGMGITNAAVFKLVPKYIPKAVGGAAGWVGGMGAFGGFVIPPLMGLFVTLFGIKGYSTGFAIFMLLSLTGLLILLKMQKSP